MHVSRGLAYDNFASMRNFSGFSTQKFLGRIGGREVSQLMLGSANYSVDDYPIAVIDRIEVIRGPGASIWGTNAVNGVINLVTKHSGDTQGDSVRVLLEDSEPLWVIMFMAGKSPKTVFIGSATKPGIC